MSRPVHGSNTGLLLLDNLELELINCIKCKSLPSLGQLHNLQFLKLKNMKKVTCTGNEFYCGESSDGQNEVITAFPALKRFTLEEMESLEERTAMAATIMFTFLEEFVIFECPLLKNVPLTGRCLSLEKLSIEKCSNLRVIVDGLATSTRLKELTLAECSNLCTLPNLNGFSILRNIHVSKCWKLEIVPISGACLSLEKLWISGCTRLSKIGDGLSTSTCLRELSLSYCQNLSSIPGLEGFSCLQRFEVVACHKLERVPLIGPVSSLKKLSIRSCPNLRSTASVDGLSSLTEVEFHELGKGFTCLPPTLLQSSTCLCNLTISGLRGLISVPEGLGNLHFVSNLTIKGSPRLRTVPDDSLTCLGILTIGGFSEELEEFPGLNSIQHLSASLRVLHLIGWEKLKSLPYQLQLLTALEELTIERFQGIEALPEWLGNLPSLKRLQIVSCNNLMRLPPVDVIRSLSKLRTFEFSQCPQLETRCAKESGRKWSKISHIPGIWINPQRIK